MNMSHVEFRILNYLNLAKSPSYPAEMIEESQGSLKRGTAYTTLRRMEDKGLIVSRKQSEAEVVYNVARRLYSITHDGREQLADIRSEMVDLLGIGLDDGGRQVLRELFNDGSVDGNVEADDLDPVPLSDKSDGLEFL